MSSALQVFVSEMDLVAGFSEQPGELTVHAPWDMIIDCGPLRDAFSGHLSDWADENLHEDDAAHALAWAEYLESLAAEIRAAVQQSGEKQSASNP